MLNFGTKSESKFDKVAFQVLVFPKNEKIIFDQGIDYFELTKDLAKNYLQKYKQEN